MPTAAAVIIGNEILTGKFADENGPYLIHRLRTLGCDLLRVAVIPDDVRVIADEVRACAAAYDHVVTSGGVGPTHDDVTLEGVAAAFSVPLEPRDELRAVLRRFGLAETEANLRMTQVPRGAELVDHAAINYPIVRMRNVWVLPGVPKLFKVKFEAIADRFAGDAVATARIYTDEWETDIADRLTAIAARFPTVAIGSYPRFGEVAYKVVVTLESRDRDALAAAHAACRATFSVVDIDGAKRG